MSATLAERLDRKTMPEANSGCWLWIGADNGDGYGQLRMGKTTRYAHRLTYELLVGSIPLDYELDHLCRTPSCVNPKHVEPVTGRVNMLRSSAPHAVASRTGYCIRGHHLSGANVLRQAHGWKTCRTCRNAWYRARYARQMAKTKEIA